MHARAFTLGGRLCRQGHAHAGDRAAALRRVPRPSEGGGDDAVGSPPRAQISYFEFFELVIFLKADRRLSVEQFEATASQSRVSHPLLGLPHLNQAIPECDRTRCVHIYIYIHGEREREREISLSLSLYFCMYIYI